jgi:hypothetical protein
MDNNDNDSDEDEFLPIVTEANLQILNHVGETGDHSAILSPSSSWNDPSSSIQPKEGIAYQLSHILIIVQICSFNNIVTFL